MEQLPVLYRDKHLVAVNKPSGLLVHRSPIDRHETRFALQLVLAKLVVLQIIVVPLSEIVTWRSEISVRVALNRSSSQTFSAVSRSAAYPDISSRGSKKNSVSS